MPLEEIRISGARQHNLKNIDLVLPRNKLVVVTGVSGSGKSSLAFDTLYAEGQRRYVESLSVYARQFLDQLEKPDVDGIEGLSPAIAIEQKTVSGSPRSTVGTSTEVNDFLRLLFAHVGKPHHPKTGKPLERWTVQRIVDEVMGWGDGMAVHILAPVVDGSEGEWRDVLERARRDGYVRARIDGVVRELEGLTALERGVKHRVEVVVDRLRVNGSVRERLTDSIETALNVGEKRILILRGGIAEDAQEWWVSTMNYDAETGYMFPELTPRHFSFNSPDGACPHCHGLGTEMALDADLLVPDGERTLQEMPIGPWKLQNAGIAAGYRRILEELAAYFKEPLTRRWVDCSEAFRKAVIYGTGKLGVIQGAKNESKKLQPFEGVVMMCERLYRESESEITRRRLEQYFSKRPCNVCGGARLRPEILAVRIVGGGERKLNIHEVGELTIEDALNWIEGIRLSEYEGKVAQEVLRELKQRLGFLKEVGLGYLTLNRESSTLSGGEAQRIRLAAHLGSRLTGVLYILDEPSIGLHQKDNDRLIKVLKQLRDLGNTVIVVEHDEDMMRAADYLVDMGPKAGARGGEIVAVGRPNDVKANPRSITGRFLSGEERISVPRSRKKPYIGWLRVVGARENNLKNITVSFPIGLFTCVTGVSGSGKSTLVNDILCRALFRKLYGSKEKPGEHDRIEGMEEIDKVVVVDQSPIGRTPRSNPLTYIGAYNGVRDLFASMPAARVRGYGSGRFSFNVAGGRCPHCEGDGVKKIEMSFLPPIYVTCEVCGGKRFNRETLEILYKGRNIADVLEMTVDEGINFFKNIPGVSDKLVALAQVGLGYLKLGQQATTLSGGEAQRVKLAAELAKKSTGRTAYIFDEPTTGLHFTDIQILLDVFYKLREAGNTLIVIEHNLHMIKCADYIIDLGPEGGGAGGNLVAFGAPEKIIQDPQSITGQYLKQFLHQ
jgi:excinuclease ABC subunit A